MPYNPELYQTACKTLVELVANSRKHADKAPRIQKTQEQWREELTDEQFRILRNAGTEAPGSSELEYEGGEGIYVAVDSGIPLFRSDAKFDSGCGWPSFFDPIDDSVIEYRDDTTHGYRVEIRERATGAHLGHVFPDGPPPTGLRYCLNGAALKFIPGKK